MQERIKYIDTLKGFAIFLMVMGHVIAWQFPSYQSALDENPHSTMLVWRLIYSFHMPLLMFCSGLFALRIKEYTWKAIGSNIWKRFCTLLVPFFVAGGIHYMIFRQQLFGYWYLWILFQFIIVVTLVDGICSLLHRYHEAISTTIIVTLAILVHIFYDKFLYLNRYPFLDIVHWKLFLYFCMGVICSRYDLCEKWFSKNWFFSGAIAMFCVLSYWITIQGRHIPYQHLTWCLLPLSAIISLVYLFKVGFAESRLRSILWLQDIGKHSLEMYIIHGYFLFRMYPVGDFVLKQANMTGGGRTIFITQLVSSFVASVIIIILSYIVMNVINKSKILSPLLLGRKSEFI